MSCDSKAMGLFGIEIPRAFRRVVFAGLPAGLLAGILARLACQACWACSLETAMPSGQAGGLKAMEVVRFPSVLIDAALACGPCGF